MSSASRRWASDKATGEFNAQNMLERVVTWIPNPMMGDMQVEIRYSDWRDVGNGIKAPFHIHMHQGDHPLVRGMNYMDVQASDVKVNVQNAALTVPDAVRTAAVPQVNVQTTKLADGVWLIAGGSHNSVAVEFKDFAAIIETPLDDARTNAVIAETKRLIPNKQIGMSSIRTITGIIPADFERLTQQAPPLSRMN